MNVNGIPLHRRIILYYIILYAPAFLGFYKYMAWIMSYAGRNY